jgi:phage terminase large subunit GpA-like protein
MFPYSVEPLNSLIDPHVKKVTLCFGSQSSKTTTMYAGVGYLLAEFPKDTLWIMPSAENARNFSKGRWLPFVEDCTALRDLCPIAASSGKIDSDKITNMRQEFLNCTLTFAGAGSENNVKSAPVAYLILDEIDEIDADIRKAALERVKGRREYKILQSSTPKTETSGIWEEYLAGDQRKYFMPCPHCQEEILFEWRQKDTEGKLQYSIGFDETAKDEETGQYDFEKVAATAHYRCPCCQGKILDAHKPQMLKQGRWVAQNPLAPRWHRSYHLSSLYAPALTFADLITAWLQNCNSDSGLRKFIQGNLAEPWRDEMVNEDQLDANQLEGDHVRGEIVGEYRIMSVDTQTDHFRWIVRGFNATGESFLLDYGSVPSFTDLDAAFMRLQCHRAIIDSAGDRTQEIYDAVYARRSKWFASRGWAKMQEPYRVQQKDPFTGDNTGRKRGGKILYLHIDKSVWEPEVAKLRSGQMSGFKTFQETPKDYYDQLFGAYWVQKTDGNGKITAKRKTKKCGDHYFDCECLALALSRFLGIGRADAGGMSPIGQKKRKTARSSRNRSSTGGFW